MINDVKKNKKLLIIITLLLIATIGITLAYFQAQIGAGATANVTVTAKTTDVLTFSKGNDINITATQQNFGSGAGNRTGSTTVTASLRANNNSNSATQTYYLFFYISENTFEYCELEPHYYSQKAIHSNKIYSDLVNHNSFSNNNINRLVSTYCDVQTPELLLTIIDPSGNPVTSISGLTYTTVNGVSGFDITTKIGLIQIASNYSITSNSSSTATNQTWNFTVSLINLNSDQQYNTNKTFSAEAIIQKSLYWNDNFIGTYVYSYPLGQKSSNYGTTWTSGSPTTYTTLAQLQSNYANFSTNPFYIKTTTEHQACLYYNNHEFCLSANYWEGTIGVIDSAAGLATKNKLQTAMESALATSTDICHSDGSYAGCMVGDFFCLVEFYGNVHCASNVSGASCEVFTDGPAICSSSESGGST